MKSVQVRFDYPERLSRGILLLKTFLGLLICIPHFVCLWVLFFISYIVAFISWFAVLFTGKYPKPLFDYMVGVIDWTVRLSAYLGLLRDEYPKFGLKAEYPAGFSVTYPEKLSRGILILRLLFGWLYVGIPHCVCLYIRYILAMIVMLISWFVILFTGKLPNGMFSFISGTFRWGFNVFAYFFFLTDEYPPFSGKDKDSVSVGTGVSA